MTETKPAPRSKLVAMLPSEPASNEKLRELNAYRMTSLYEQGSGVLNAVFTEAGRPIKTEAQMLGWTGEQRQEDIDRRAAAGWALRFVVIVNVGEALAFFEFEA